MYDDDRYRGLARIAVNWITGGAGSGEQIDRLREFQHAVADQAAFEQLVLKAGVAGLLAGSGVPATGLLADAFDPDTAADVAAYRRNLVFTMALEQLRRDDVSGCLVPAAA